MSENMHGKICLITGATSGIGYETARALARQGAELVLIGRNRSKLDETLKTITGETPAAKISTILADLSRPAEVKKAAAEFKAKYGQLHVLVNNAGGMYWERQETPDGLEMTFALNHMAYFILTNELLDLLKASAPARIVNVSSGAHQMTRGVDFDDLQLKKAYGGFLAYSQSKLFNLWFTYELARQLKGTDVAVNAVHPGAVNTGFGKNNSGWKQRIISFLIARAGLTPEKGAATLIYLASSPEVEGITGKYFYNQKAQKSNAYSYDETAQKRLWQQSLTLAGQ